MNKVTRRSLLTGLIANHVMKISPIFGMGPIAAPQATSLETLIPVTTSSIQQKHALLLRQGLNLGRPTRPEEKFEDGGSRQAFQFGNIYFHPSVGAFEVHGSILQKYLEMGENRSRLGYPVTDEVDSPSLSGGRTNGFELGVLLFNPNTRLVTPHVIMPQVVVKLHESIPINLGQNETLRIGQFAALAGASSGSVIAEIARRLPDLELRRLFDAMTPHEMRNLVAEARKNNTNYSGPNLETFLQIRCPVAFDTAPLLSALRQLVGLVERAYDVRPIEVAGVIGITNPRFFEQKYLLPAPTGIGVLSAWLKGADGTGCRLVDMEHGWLLNRELIDQHEDLPLKIPLLAGFNRRSERGHGAAVFGVIAARDNNVGVVGIAPKTTIQAISPFDPPPNPLLPPHQDVVGRLKIAEKHLAFGDVLLLEVQTEGDKLPVETDDAVSAYIAALTSKGVVVVECSGNGGTNLDKVQFFGDSGAILVGACTSTPEHSRMRKPPSNFGARIDCNAWGENVLTTGSKKDLVSSRDYFNFEGTSAAGAIIAGVCLLVQELHRRKTGHALHPHALRSILRDPKNCTVTKAASADGIRHMPDLAKIIANLGL